MTALVWLSPHARNLSSALQPIWPTTSEARLYLHPPWCVRRFAKNLKATSGGEDLDPEALMSFLYTLTDGAEIKGYLSEFLVYRMELGSLQMSSSRERHSMQNKIHGFCL